MPTSAVPQLVPPLFSVAMLSVASVAVALPTVGWKALLYEDLEGVSSQVKAAVKAVLYTNDETRTLASPSGLASVNSLTKAEFVNVVKGPGAEDQDQYPKYNHANWMAEAIRNSNLEGDDMAQAPLPLYNFLLVSSHDAQNYPASYAQVPGGTFPTYLIPANPSLLGSSVRHVLYRLKQ